MSPEKPVTRRELWRITRYMEIMLAVLVVVLLGLGGWSVWLQVQHGNEVNAIQHQRELTIIESCRSQNERNAVLSAFLNGLPTTKKASAKQRALLNEFVQALAPHEDCHAALLRRTGRQPAHKPKPKPKAKAPPKKAHP